MDQRSYTAIGELISVSGIVLLILINLVACQSTLVEKKDPLPIVTRTDPRIDSLLEAAENALMKNRLTEPLDDNAYFRYLQVLSIDPQSEAAETGIAAIADQYLGWSIRSVEMGRYRRATDYLNKARSVDETHPNIAAVENMISDRINGNRKSFEFSRRSIREKEPAVISELKVIARDIDAFQASIVIEAPTDELGRWIYQQLNKTAAQRVRAVFEMTSRVRVHLYY